MVIIKDLPLSIRPRERLINDGKETLNDEELLAIILKNGTKDCSSKELACKLLKNFSLQDLRKCQYEQLIKIKGIGSVKACELLATIELGKRLYQHCYDIKNVKINSPDLVYQYYKDKLANEEQECFYCIYLDNQKRVINAKQLFVGTLNYSMVHPREVFKTSYLYGATAIICLHNHPSGNPLPSIQDYELTDRLIKIGQILDISVVDHIIIGNKKYYSFKENGDIK